MCRARRQIDADQMVKSGERSCKGVRVRQVETFTILVSCQSDRIRIDRGISMLYGICVICN